MLLRSERTGNGNGRVHTIVFEADDGEGGTCAGAVTVCVPHSRKRSMTCTDDGEMSDSTQR